MEYEDVVYANLSGFIHEIRQERDRQVKKWGKQDHDEGIWLAILTEEVGEVAQAIQKGMPSEKKTDASNLKEELIQVAAVCAAFHEYIVRKENENENKLKRGR